MAKARVVLADDHPAMLARIRRELGEEFDIVGTAGDGEEAVASVAHFDPDILVMDISMPVLNGLDAVSRLCATHCRTRIVLLTIHEDPEFVVAAMTAGASGYVTKNRLSIDLARAIREVLLGRTYVSQVASN